MVVCNYIIHSAFITRDSSVRNFFSNYNCQLQNVFYIKGGKKMHDLCIYPFSEPAINF